MDNPANEYPVEDTDFDDRILSEVHEFDDHYQVGMDGFCLAFEKTSVVPHVGDTIRTYGKFGYPCRGVFINGKKVYYRTPEEEKERHRQWCIDKEQKEIQQFEQNKAEYDKRFDALPPVFQRRIEKFRKNCPSFRWKFEAYEVTICEQAIGIANHFRRAEKIMEWAKLEDFEEQIRQYPGLDTGLSGHMFSMAVKMAYWYSFKPVRPIDAPFVPSESLDETDSVYREAEKNILREHCATAYIVGCEECGCVHDEDAP